MWQAIGTLIVTIITFLPIITKILPYIAKFFKWLPGIGTAIKWILTKCGVAWGYIKRFFIWFLGIGSGTIITASTTFWGRIVIYVKRFISFIGSLFKNVGKWVKNPIFLLAVLVLNSYFPTILAWFFMIEGKVSIWLLTRLVKVLKPIIQQNSAPAEEFAETLQSTTGDLPDCMTYMMAYMGLYELLGMIITTFVTCLTIRLLISTLPTGRTK